jgi:protein-tyrosine-phosphatase
MALITPQAVLFCCNFNRVRSVMAEAMLKRHVGTAVFVDSCGLKSSPPELRQGSDVDPFAYEVLLEVGWDVAHHRAKTFDELEDDSFDLVISLTPQAQHRAVELTRGQATEIEYWPTFDPTLAHGSREARLAAYRDVRDTLADRIAKRFGG